MEQRCTRSPGWSRHEPAAWEGALDGAEMHQESMMEQRCTCSLGRRPCWRQEDVPRGGSGPGEAHPGSGPWQKPWREEPVVQQVCCDPVGDPHWSSLFLKDCTLWQEDTWKNTLRQGKRMRRRKEQQEQRDELTTASIPQEEGNSEVKLSLGRRQGWEEGVLRFYFIFSLPNSHL